MTQYTLQISERFLRRTFEKAIGTSIIKALAEPITNSDDSYRRLEAKKTNHPSKFGEIRVIVDRGNRMLAVLDQAEGLTEAEMRDRFVEYGKESKDREVGFRTRSLFGKGLRDVLFTQRLGTVQSIEDGQSAVADFHWVTQFGRTEPVIDINPGPKVTPGLRERWGISANGTRVEFELRQDIPFPTYPTLCERLRDFYMLRLINSNPKRRLVVETLGAVWERETPIRFTPILGDPIVKKSLILRVDAKEFPVDLEINRATAELSQGDVGVEARSGGLLVTDEDLNALDLTLFKYDTEPLLSRIFGTVRIRGVGVHIKERLNSQPPEEILTETRDGFDKKNKFYKSLSSLIEPYLDEILKDELKRQEGPSETFSKQTRENIAKALNVMSSLYEQLVGRADIGDEFKGKTLFKPEVIEFIRRQFTITENVSTPIALLMNSDKVPERTIVSLRSSSNDVNVEPEQFEVSHEKSKDGVLTKVVRVIGKGEGVTATVTAECPQGRTTTLVTVTSQTIFYPANGLQFHPESITLHEGRVKHLELYVDALKIPVGTLVRISVDNDAFELPLTVQELLESDKLNHDIGRLRFSVAGKGIGARGNIDAVCGSFTARAFVRVADKKEKEPPEQGTRFKEPVFQKIHLPTPSIMRPDGTVVINMNDEVNARYFGDNPLSAVDRYVHCQTRLADLVLDECLTEIVTKGFGRTSELEVRFPNDPAVDIRSHVARLKFVYGPVFHSAFVKFSEVSEQGGSPNAIGPV